MDIDIDFSNASFSENRVVAPLPNNSQTKLDFKPEYYGLKINECELVKHNITVMEIIQQFAFEYWVVGRDDALGHKGIPHYHIHFKSDKKIDALRKQKQKVMPNWGQTTKLYAPRKNASDWYCWAGYALKEMKVGLSSNHTPEDIIEIDKHIHTQATIKKSKLNWSEKEVAKKEEKKDLETRLFDKLDKEYLGKSYAEGLDICATFGEEYFKEVGELPSGHHTKSKVYKWLFTRKVITMRQYMDETTDFRNSAYNW